MHTNDKLLLSKPYLKKKLIKEITNETIRIPFRRNHKHVDKRLKHSHTYKFNWIWFDGRCGCCCFVAGGLVALGLVDESMDMRSRVSFIFTHRKTLPENLVCAENCRIPTIEYKFNSSCVCTERHREFSRFLSSMYKIN